MYIWQKSDWPKFGWNSDELINNLAQTRYQDGLFYGQIKSIGFDQKLELEAETVTTDAIKTSLIESVYLDGATVRSSVAFHLGLLDGWLSKTDRAVDGLVQILLDATHHSDQPLTVQRLFDWHLLLFPNGIAGLGMDPVARYRDDKLGPMQVISGSFGRIKVHYQAPPATIVAREMAKFLEWFNASHDDLDSIIFAAISHLWFVTIHPFEDGNGRISRAIADLAIAKLDRKKQRFYSLSSSIELDKKNYYNILEYTQKKTSTDITNYLKWFVHCYHQAILNSTSLVDRIIHKANFYQSHSSITNGLSPNQLKIINMFLDGQLEQIDLKNFIKITKSNESEFLNLIENGLLQKTSDSVSSRPNLTKFKLIN